MPTGAFIVLPPIVTASPDTLGALKTSGLSDGQEAWVENAGDSVPGGALYIFQTLSATADDKYIISAADRLGKQWVRQGILGQEQFAYVTAPVDLTTPVNSISVAPGITGSFFMPSRIGVLNKTVGGAVSVAPTIRVGNNGGHNNVLATTGALTSTAAFGLGVGGGAYQNIDLYNAAMVLGSNTLLDVVSGATDTTPVWSARFIVYGVFVKP